MPVVAVAVEVVRLQPQRLVVLVDLVVVVTEVGVRTQLPKHQELQTLAVAVVAVVIHTLLVQVEVLV